MIQKVLKIGNSFGVTIPKEFIDENQLKPGSDVEITYKVPTATKYEEVSDGEFFDVIKEVESKYKNALDKLADLK